MTAQWTPKLDLSPCHTPIHSPLQTPHATNQPQRLGANDRSSSSKDVNMLFNQYQQEKCTTQESIQSAQKKDRWICSVPLRILMKLVDIYDELLKKFDKEAPGPLLVNAQIDYDNMLREVFKEFEGFQEDVFSTREGEFSTQCNHEFESMLSKNKRDVGESVINAKTKELKNKQKMLNRQTVTDNLVLLNEVEEMALAAQLQLLTITKTFQEDFYNQRAQTEEDNQLFYDFKYKQFNGVLFAGSLSAQNEVYSDVIEKAKSVCSRCFQFDPKFVCASEHFANTIDLNYLETRKITQLSPVKKEFEIEFTKTALQAAKESVQTQLKSWDTSLKILNKASVDLVIISEHCQTELKKLDKLSENQESTPWSVVKKGQLSDVKKYFSQLDMNSFDINDLHEVFGYTLLHTAISRAEKGIAQYLFEHGASQLMFSIKLLEGYTCYYTPLHLAAAMCAPELVALCLKNHQNSSYFSESFLVTEDLDTPTESEKSSAKYTILHLAIKPRLLFKQLSEEEFKRWKDHSNTVVKLMLDKGASIQAPGCTSAFFLAVDEYIVTCQEVRTKGIRMLGDTNNQTKIACDVLGSLTELFLSRPELSFDQVKEGAKRLMEYFSQKRLEQSELQLLQKLVKHAYFASEEGKKFLSSFQDLIKAISETGMKKPPSNVWLQVTNSSDAKPSFTPPPRKLTPLTRTNSNPHHPGNSILSPRKPGNQTTLQSIVTKK